MKPFSQFLKKFGLLYETHLGWSGMKQVPFAVNTMIGVIVHSALSYRGNREYFVVRDSIYYTSDGPLFTPDPKVKPQDIIRENLIVEMLNGVPQTLKIYEPIYNDTRLGIFDFSFNNATETLYHEFIRKIPLEIRTCIERQEKTQMLQRIARNEHTLSKMIQALCAEDHIAEGYAIQLEQNLRLFGYRGLTV